jgi:glycosyltransferase involved in cell wall biosynthesis
MGQTPNVLILGTYPIKAPVHGGQRRSAALRAAYLAHGVRAAYVAVYNPQAYLREADRCDIPVGRVLALAAGQDPDLAEVLIGERCLDDPGCSARLVQAWERVRPDAVQLEQPYLWPAVRGLVQAGRVARPKIIYSSQNVEWQMKAEMHPNNSRVWRRVREIEEDLTRSADLVLAVSESDARHFASLGPKKTLVMRNGGVFPAPAGPSRRGDRGKRYGLFVSSEHPPNLAGFEKMCGPNLGYLPPDAEIVVAGGIKKLVAQSRLLDGIYADLNRSRLNLVGRVSDGRLAELLRGSAVVLLPVTSGGGSNLKTVEALFARRMVVATSVAFRSFEEYTGLSYVQVKDDPADFRQAVRRLLSGPTPPPPGAADLDLDRRLSALTWESLAKACVPQILAAL